VSDRNTFNCVISQDTNLVINLAVELVPTSIARSTSELISSEEFVPNECKGCIGRFRGVQSGQNELITISHRACVNKLII
jgi:hypothetical protein